jgi:hypothetical protein
MVLPEKRKGKANPLKRRAQETLEQSRGRDRWKGTERDLQGKIMVARNAQETVTEKKGRAPSVARQRPKARRCKYRKK